VAEEIRRPSIETSASLPALVCKRRVHLSSKPQAKSFLSMVESNGVTNTAHLMIFILGSEGGFIGHEEVDSSCNMKGSAVCRRFVHESKVCSLELG
jgi:hypothetical protein